MSTWPTGVARCSPRKENVRHRPPHRNVAARLSTDALRSRSTAPPSVIFQMTTCTTAIATTSADVLLYASSGGRRKSGRGAPVFHREHQSSAAAPFPGTVAIACTGDASQSPTAAPPFF
ncbi:hypothetical protein DFJ73DRAFT_786605 [Zopfochytrium polystomum]|nr:hypothetical protein DFJ73DRAFT_786605 [Zopfochytrium polystomum]